jgi:hypothetical protein
MGQRMSIAGYGAKLYVDDEFIMELPFTSFLPISSVEQYKSMILEGLQFAQSLPTALDKHPLLKDCNGFSFIFNDQKYAFQGVKTIYSRKKYEGMPNKPFDKLNELDKKLRHISPPGMVCGPQIIITKFCGFELFNTRPYHNYENFSDGYRVEGFGIKVESEDLDDAVNLFCDKVKNKESN